MGILSSGRKSILESQIETLTPPSKKNWNWGRGKRGYAKKFSAHFIEYVFPYVLRNASELGVPTGKIKLLDIGCGWAPMAIPYVIYEASQSADQGRQIGYLGIDIREDAIKWLSQAYADYPYVKFHHHQVKSEADYINAEYTGSKTDASSDGAETDYAVGIEFVHNVQWSSSVFTHLTPQACLQALKFVRSSCEQNSMQVNTWLIIDNESRYALTAGLADRTLPFDCGDYLTYSDQNPLVCTAYKIEAIERMYAECGLEIVRIDRGAWRGTAYKNDANHYQDIIISKPFRQIIKGA